MTRVSKVVLDLRGLYYFTALSDDSQDTVTVDPLFSLMFCCDQTIRCRTLYQNSVLNVELVLVERTSVLLVQKLG